MTRPKITREHLGADRVVWTVDSGVPGPVLGLTANIHGDESTGLVMLNQVLEQGHRLQKGRLRIFPSLNPEGLVEIRREDPRTGRDLNRLFPNCLDASSVIHPELRSVWRALQESNLDMLVDVHSDSGLAVPYVLMDRQLKPNVQVFNQLLDMTSALGLFTMREYLMPDYRRYQLQRTLTGSVLNSLEIPCVTMEIGRRRHVSWDDVCIGLSALGRLFVQYELFSETDIAELDWTRPPIPENGGVWRRDNGPITREEGLVVPVARLGELLREGDPIAKIVNAQGVTRETVCAKETSIVLAFPDKAWTERWLSICTIGVLER